MPAMRAVTRQGQSVLQQPRASGRVGLVGGSHGQPEAQQSRIQELRPREFILVGMVRASLEIVFFLAQVWGFSLRPLGPLAGHSRRYESRLTSFWAPSWALQLNLGIPIVSQCVPTLCGLPQALLASILWPAAHPAISWKTSEYVSARLGLAGRSGTVQSNP